jgi:hypothetical protein
MPCRRPPPAWTWQSGNARATDRPSRAWCSIDKRRIAKIDALLPAARKLVELLEETRAVLDDRRQRQMSAIATAAEGRAKVLRKPELLAKYEKTRAYRSAGAMKGVRTRRRNESAGAETPAVEQRAENPS